MMAMACPGQLGAEAGEESSHLTSAIIGVPRRSPQLCAAGRHQQLFSVGNRSSQNKEGIKPPPKGPLKRFIYFWQKKLYTPFCNWLYRRPVMGRNFSPALKILKLWDKTQRKEGKSPLQIKHTGKFRQSRLHAATSSAQHKP